MAREQGTFVRLDDDERAALERICRKEERTMSDVMRRALRRYDGTPAIEQAEPSREERVGRWFLNLPAEILSVLGPLAAALQLAPQGSLRMPEVLSTAPSTRAARGMKGKGEPKR